MTEITEDSKQIAEKISCTIADLSKEESVVSFPCFICKDFLYEPMVFSCGHSMCFFCFQHITSHNKNKINCPLCKKETLKVNVNINYALREILETVYKSEYEIYKKSLEYKTVQTLEKYKTENNIQVLGVESHKNPEKLLKLLIFTEKNYLELLKTDTSMASIFSPFLEEDEFIMFFRGFMNLSAHTTLLVPWCIYKPDYYSIFLLRKR